MSNICGHDGNVGSVSDKKSSKFRKEVDADNSTSKDSSNESKMENPDKILCNGNLNETSAHEDDILSNIEGAECTSTTKKNLNENHDLEVESEVSAAFEENEWDKKRK